MQKETPQDIQPGRFPARVPLRPANSHKGDFGTVGIIGGTPGMAGAALLAGRAALMCGAGRVMIGLLDERIGMDTHTPELMISTPSHALQLPGPGCVVIGPGLGQSGAARGWLEQALAVPCPLILDADALNLIALDDTLNGPLAPMLAQRPHPTLLTPHPGEAARLLHLNTAQVQADRPEAIRTLATRFQASIVLKGHASLVLGRDAHCWRNTTGNPGMAAPGMGDVLAGIIAALCAQGLSLDQAAVLGVWLHGAAGDLAVKNGRGPVGLTASEVIDAARQLLNNDALNTV